jgi:nitrite reductase/ring-hydroxylating ferredoxin subunit
MVAGTVGGTRLPSDVGEFTYGLAGQVLRCPWHTYEFDLTTGRCLADPDRLKLNVYRVEQTDTEVVIHV